ncbi:serine/threonine-protein phosphatase 2A 56 kDa regulatory subunit gamma (RTS1) [Vairimorpha necatrix]|uniref:Serine/threonine-protein phosphatase 2A 56 kDa regulatory subunit gamma (RTS1) n=1 Tax=Vairimorpha necatrix TaxID=6039 RepID=A0AAX4J8X2_9MICR
MKNEDRERKTKKQKLNPSILEENTENKKQNIIFNIPENIIEKRRPLKTRNIIKEIPTKNDSSILLNIHSEDPLTLHDLFIILSKTKITDLIFTVVIRKCKEKIFRDIKNQNKTGRLFYPWDDTNIKNKVTSNINIFTRIFSLLTSKHKNILKQEISDSDIYSLFNLLKSEDEKERFNILQIIINIKDLNKKLIQNIIENELLLFYDEERTHVGIEEILEIIENLNLKDETFYYQIILKFLHIKNLEFYKNIENIIYKYSSEDYKIGQFTLKYLYKIYKEIEFINKSVIVKLYFQIYLRWSRRIQFKNVIEEICEIINYGLKSEYQNLIENIMKIGESKIMRNLLKENINEILPKIFDNLYILSKKYWASKEKVKIYKFISLLLSMNHECFEKCLIKYNKNKYETREINKNKYEIKEINKNESVMDILIKCLENSEINQKEQNIKRRNSTNHK